MIELILVLLLLGVLAVAGLTIFNPQQRVWAAQAQQALSDMEQLARAIETYAIDNGNYPGEVTNDIPDVLGDYIRFNPSWPDGPFPGSVYDYDNLQLLSCEDPMAEGSVQVRLRNVPGRGGEDWVWYRPVIGTGSPDCLDVSAPGECVSCVEFSL